ncbi:MAG TPA: hypothetical protein VN611_14565 [Patescibacteria group bacterium]|nr:hypothetical protein [Patescibacteria group bacterium]
MERLDGYRKLSGNDERVKNPGIAAVNGDAPGLFFSKQENGTCLPQSCKKSEGVMNIKTWRGSVFAKITKSVNLQEGSRKAFVEFPERTVLRTKVR